MAWQAAGGAGSSHSSQVRRPLPPQQPAVQGRQAARQAGGSSLAHQLRHLERLGKMHGVGLAVLVLRLDQVQVVAARERLKVGRQNAALISWVVGMPLQRMPARSDPQPASPRGAPDLAQNGAGGQDEAEGAHALPAVRPIHPAALGLVALASCGRGQHPKTVLRSPTAPKAGAAHSMRQCSQLAGTHAPLGLVAASNTFSHLQAGSGQPEVMARTLGLGTTAQAPQGRQAALTRTHDTSATARPRGPHRSASRSTCSGAGGSASMAVRCVVCRAAQLNKHHAAMRAAERLQLT